MQRLLDGQDPREIEDVIRQEGHNTSSIPWQSMSLSSQDRKDTDTTTNTADSGFCGSTHCQHRLHRSDCSCSSSSYQGVGNGWSCGMSLAELDCTTGRCCRHRPSLKYNASVLPTGQLVSAEGLTSPQNDSESSDHCREDTCKKCYHYDADDETDADTIHYDVVNIRKLRVKKWLNSMPPYLLPPDQYDGGEGQDEAILTTGQSCVPEYDVISIPCSQKQVIPGTCFTSHSIEFNDSAGDTCDEDSSGKSDYSVVHSSIGGLELQDTSTGSESSSLSSAGVFRTYDVVEMLELTSWQPHYRANYRKTASLKN